MSKFRNNRGIALPIVLIIILILTFLGTALWQYSVQDTIYAEKNEKRMQAYYLARSGADALAQYIIDNPDGIEDMKQFVDQLVAAPQSEPTYISNEVDGYFQVEVSRDEEENLIIIESTGTVDEISRKVTLTLHEIEGGYDWDEAPLDMAVFSETDLYLKGNGKKEIKIDGDVATNSTEPNSVELNGKVLVNGNLFIGPEGDPEKALSGDRSNITGYIENLPQKLTYDLPPFPEFPHNLPQRGSLTVDKKTNFYIKEDGEYNDINVKNKSKLIIHIGDKDLTLKVNTLTVKGDIVLDKMGNGRLYLYINDGIKLNGGSTINDNGDPEDIFIYHKGKNQINDAGNTKFVGCLYAESADIKVNGNEGIIGHIITGGKNVSIKGNSEVNARMLYAPKANVDINGSSETYLRGMLVCGSLTAKGDLRITFDESIKETFSEFWKGGMEDEVVYKKGIWE